MKSPSDVILGAIAVDVVRYVVDALDVEVALSPAAAVVAFPPISDLIITGITSMPTLLVNLFSLSNSSSAGRLTGSLAFFMW